MIEFEYSGRDGQGRKISGQRQANSQEELANALMAESIIPTKISAKEKPTEQFSLLPTKQKVALDELELFSRQMHSLLRAGIPIAQALQRLSESNQQVYFSEILMELKDALNKGQTLVAGLVRYPHVFSELFVSMVRIGEETGQLDVIFDRLAKYINLEIETKKKLKATFRYPIIVVSTLLLALFIINVFVIPQFAKIFDKFKGQLPLPTKILIGTSDFLSTYWPYLLVLVVVALFSFNLYIKTENGRIQWHRTLLRLPILGGLVHKMYLARFCRLYALILRSGISAVDGLHMVANATGNAYLSQQILRVIPEIAKGATLSSACNQVKLFSHLVLQMLMVGEETGQIDTMLQEVAIFYEREVDYQLSKLNDLLEPILLIFMAGMVLVLALGVFLPMWDMVNVMKR